SNVGMAHIALSLPPQQIWTTLNHLGFGLVTTSGYPGESAGLLATYAQWRPINIVTMSHGYGLAVTPLQPAHAYAAIGGVSGGAGGRVPGSAGTAARRTRDRGAGVPRVACNARVGRHGRRHRQARCHSRLSRFRQDRHGIQGDCGWLFDRSLHGGVWWRGARY